MNDKSLTDLDNLPELVLANDSIETLKSGIGRFQEIMPTINGKLPALWGLASPTTYYSRRIGVLVQGAAKISGKSNLRNGLSP